MKKPLSIAEAFAILGVTRQEIDNALATVPFNEPDVWKKRTSLFHSTIKKRQRAIMMECHPDRNPTPEALERAQMVNSIVDELLQLEVGPPEQRFPAHCPVPPMPFPGVVRIVVTVGGFGANMSSTSTSTNSVTGDGWWPGF